MVHRTLKSAHSPLLPAASDSYTQLRFFFLDFVVVGIFFDKISELTILSLLIWGMFMIYLTRFRVA